MRMNRYITKTAVLFLATLLFSCQDVINVDLKNAAPRIVIEGSVSNESDSVIVMVHKTTDYYKPTEIAPVNDALVTVKDSAGNDHQFARIADGVYATVNVKAKPGDIFDLEVSEQGMTYYSEAKMPELVPIEAVSIDKNPDLPTEDRINIYINDPAGISNYYQVEIFKNDSLLKSGEHFILYSDKYFDGKLNVLPITGRRLGIREFKSGDRIRVRLVNLERSMYDYFDILRNITNEEQVLSASSPANPPNNITNGALGYFAAWSVNEVTVIRM